MNRDEQQDVITSLFVWGIVVVCICGMVAGFMRVLLTGRM